MNRSFRIAVACSALIQGGHAAYYGFAPLFFRAQGYSDTVIGLLIAEGIIAEIVLFAWGRGLIERLGAALRRRLADFVLARRGDWHPDFFSALLF